MKPLNALVGVPVLVCLLLSSCFGPSPAPQKLRVKTLEWDNILYRAQYDSHGTLTKLKGTDRDINFYYDEHDKLYEATITINGVAIPDMRYTYSHGPWGITEIKEYGHVLLDDQLHIQRITQLDYLTPTKLATITQLEMYEDEDGSPVVGFTLERQVFYSGNNVNRIVTSPPPFADYSVSAYDNKANPFMVLAEAVNNPAFFPVGLFANFPNVVLKYNIPVITVFSQNNPLQAIYEIFDVQTFTYTYENNLVKKIIWKAVFDVTGPVDIRTFKFDYEWARCAPKEHHGHL